MKIDSDIPNPDSHLGVVFYSRLVPNAYESEKQQRSISYSADYIKITVPGNKHLEIDTPVREQHKQRFPFHWAAYQNRVDAGQAITGTPIAEWSRITPAQAEELRGLKFYTVEAIAGASDAQLQSIGMIAGQNSFTFRDDAKRFLSVADAAAKLKEADAKQAEADAKLAEANAQIKAQQEQHMKDMQEMKEQMQRLLASAVPAAAGVATPVLVPATRSETPPAVPAVASVSAPIPAKRGRPAKEAKNA
jgi:hypothetical protein